METALVVSSILLWLVLLLNLLLTFGLIRRLNNERRQKAAPPLEMLEAGQPAPDFSAQALNGDIVTLSSYAGQRVAFHFISTGCEPCREYLPQLEQLHPQATQAGIDLVLVSADPLEETRTFVERMNIHLPILAAPRKSNPFFETYKANLTPSYTLINEKGIIESAGLPNLVGGAWEKLTQSWASSPSSVASERR